MTGNYRVFISFKSEDINGNTTWDAIMGEKIHDALEARGIKTFFSPVSIPEETCSDYQDMIFQALDEADILVAMCSNPDYLKSGWIKEEIDTFRMQMLNEKKNKFTSGIYVFKTPELKEHDFSISMQRAQMYDKQDTLVDVISRRIASEKKVMDHFQRSVYLDNKTKAPKRGKEHELIGKLINNRYKVLGIIGVGGMGFVCEAIDEQRNRKVAIKCVNRKGKGSDEFRKQLLSEAAILKQVSSIHVPKIYNVFEMEDSVQCVAMSLIEGESTDVRVQKGIPFSEEEVIKIGKQICEVMLTIHGCSPKIIHRDIKPSNLIVQEDGNVVLIDFGSARNYKENQSVDTVLLGTRGYAAPEQYGGLGQTDERTDIFGFGMALLALITGKVPASSEIDMNHVYEFVEPKSRALACIIERCTELDVVNRYQSAREILWNLENPEQVVRQPRRIYEDRQRQYDIHLTPDNMYKTAFLLGEPETSDSPEPFASSEPEPRPSGSEPRPSGSEPRPSEPEPRPSESEPRPSEHVPVPVPLFVPQSSEGPSIVRPEIFPTVGTKKGPSLDEILATGKIPEFTEELETEEAKNSKLVPLNLDDFNFDDDDFKYDDDDFELFPGWDTEFNDDSDCESTSDSEPAYPVKSGDYPEAALAKVRKEYIGKICVSNARLRDGQLFVHVYLSDREHLIMMEKFVRDHLDYEMVIDTPAVEMDEDKAVTVGVDSRDILFDGPKTGFNIGGIIYFCFRARYPIADINKTRLKIKIRDNTGILMETKIKLENTSKKRKKKRKK